MISQHALIIFIGIAAICAVGALTFTIFQNPMSRTPSDDTDYETKRIHSFCQNQEITSQGNDVFVTCHHPANYTNIGLNLQLPVYKRIVCQSTYGCSGHYNYVTQVPPDLLTDSQKQQVINKALNVTGLKQKYPNIQVGLFQIQSRGDQWFAEINFLIPHCNWYPNLRMNLNTVQVISGLESSQNSGC